MSLPSQGFPRVLSKYERTYFTLGEVYFGSAYSYFQLRRILVSSILQTFKKAYFGVITT